MSSENLTGKPVVSRTLPGSRKRASIPTVSDSNAQINPNITQPYIAGQTAAKLVGTITDSLNKTADQQAEKDATIAGYKAQQQAIKQGKTDYLGGGNAFTISGKAFKQGANLAMINKKKGEFDTELGKLAVKRSNKPDQFNKEAEELKTQLFQNLPSSLQLALDTDYEKARSNFNTQINVRLTTQQFEENKAEVVSGIDRNIKKIFNTVGAHGINAEDLPELFGDIQINLASLKQDYNVSPKELRGIVNTTRQQLFSQYLRTEFDNVKTNPGALKELKQKIKDGTYTFGALGEEYGEFIPGGTEITLTEASAYTAIIEQYEKDFAKDNANLKLDFNSSHDDRVEKLADGDKGFTVTYNDQGQPVTTFDPNTRTYDNDISTLYGNDATTRAKHERDLIAASMSGDLLLQIRFMNESHIEQFGKRTIAKWQEEVDSMPDGAMKSVYIRAIELAEPRMKNIIEARLKDKTRGESMQTFIEYKTVNGQADQIDLSSAQGLRPLVKEFTNWSNAPFKASDLPTGLANQVYTDLVDNFNVSMNDGMMKMDQILVNYDEFALALISQGIKNRPNAEKTNDHALLQVAFLKKAGKINEAEQLASIWSKGKEAQTDLPQLMGKTEYNEAVKTFEMKFRSKFRNKTIPLSTYHKSLYQTARLMFDRYLIAEDYNPNDAVKSTIDFIQRTNPEVERGDGNTTVLPLYITKNQYGEDRSSLIEFKMEEALEYPELSNIVVADGQTIDRVIDYKNEYVFGFDNDRMVLRQSGDFQIHPTQKLPSDGESLLLTDFTVSIDRKNAPKTVFEDIELTWDFKDKTKLSSLMPNVVQETAQVTEYDMVDDTEIPDQLDARLLTYEEALQTTFSKYNADLKPEDKYNDWFDRSLVGNDLRKRTIVQAISMKAAQGDLNHMDLLWIANNTNLGGKRNLNNKKIRDQIIQENNSNYDGFSSRSSLNEAATKLSPLQAIFASAKIAKELYPQRQIQIQDETEEFRPEQIRGY